jgi:hypothetical protein
VVPNGGDLRGSHAVDNFPNKSLSRWRRKEKKSYQPHISPTKAMRDRCHPWSCGNSAGIEESQQLIQSPDRQSGASERRWVTITDDDDESMFANSRLPSHLSHTMHIIQRVEAQRHRNGDLPRRRSSPCALRPPSPRMGGKPLSLEKFARPHVEGQSAK